MSDPRRLLDDEGTTEFERALVRSWDREQPSRSSREATLAALGLGAAVLVTTAGAGTAAAGVGAGVGGGVVAGSVAPKAAVGVFVLKWLAISTVGVAGVAGGAAYAARAERVPAVVRSPSVETTGSSPIASQVEAITPAPPTVAKTRHATAQPRRSSSLDEEVAQLDRARAALESNDPSRALELIDAYEAKHHRGSFLQEAEVLRIQALIARGDRAAANRRGNHFLVTYPNSPHAGRVRALLGSAL